MKALLSIIIVKYRSEKYLKKCLVSIGKNALWEVIVVDNDTDNIGYAAGCNKGAKKASDKYLLFLNPDTLIGKNSLEKMVDFMQKNPSVGILGPRIYANLDKERQLSFCRFPNPLTALFVYSPLRKLFPNNKFWQDFSYQKILNTQKPIDVDAVSGAATMVRRTIFERVGGFDENFFFYFEDNDLCRRVQKAGGKIVFFPETWIVHYGGKSTVDVSAAAKNFIKGRYLFFKKNYGLFVAAILETIIRFLEKAARLI